MTTGRRPTAPAEQAQPETVLRLLRTVVVLGALDGGAVVLPAGERVLSTVCATGRLEDRLEELQAVLGEGPTVDCLSTRSPVLWPDLAHPQEGLALRWPLFRPAAWALGVRAVFSLPLLVGPASLGVLSLHRYTAGALDAPQLRALLVTTDALTVALLEARVDRSLEQPGDLPASYRLAVHAAAGMVMVQLGLPIDLALARLRAAAFARGVSLNALAADIIAGHTRLDEEAGP